MQSNRRQILTGFLATGLIGSAVANAVADDAAGWPAQAFKQKSQDDAIKALFGKPADQPRGLAQVA